MQRQIIAITILIIFSNLKGQNTLIKQSTKPSDSQNIVGKWERIYEKTSSGKIVQNDKEFTEVLEYFSNKKFVKKDSWTIKSVYTSEISTWTLDENKREINYRNIQFEIISPSITTKDSLKFRQDYYGIVTKDTLTILHYSDNLKYPLSDNLKKTYQYSTAYYIRKK